MIRVPFIPASQRGAASGQSGADPVGRAVALQVVGIEASEVEFPSGNTTSPYELYATPALDRLLVRRPLTFTEYYIRLRHGPVDLSRFQADVRHLNVAGLQDEDTAAATIASSIRPQAVGWWVLAALAALAGTLVMAQALSRQAALENETYDILRSLGVSRRQLFAVGMVRTLAVAVLGVIGGVAIAYLLSPLTPVGVARVAEPSTGFALDWTVVLLAGLGAVLVAIALGIWPAMRAARMRTAYGGQALGAPSPLTGLVPRLGAAPSMSIGIRRAIVRGHGRNAVPVGSALFGAVLAVTGSARPLFLAPACRTSPRPPPSTGSLSTSGWTTPNQRRCCTPSGMTLASTGSRRVSRVTWSLTAHPSMPSWGARSGVRCSSLRCRADSRPAPTRSPLGQGLCTKWAHTWGRR